MKNISKILLLLILWGGGTAVLWGQNQDIQCLNTTGVVGEPYSGSLFFNYGSVSKAFNNKYRHSSLVGQALVGVSYNADTSVAYGFWARQLAPPTAPVVQATQGDLLDRIQLSWQVDALSPSFDDGFNIYRDGIFLASVNKNTRSYNDFNVIAGRPYVYEVRGLNIYGEGSPGKALGFQVPNGTVTGLVETVSGSPVPDALVSLEPMQGFSAKFGPVDRAFAKVDSGMTSLLPTSGAWSVTWWMKQDTALANSEIIRFDRYTPFFANAIMSHLWSNAQ